MVRSQPRWMRTAMTVLWAVLLVSMPIDGCASVGPRTVPKDQFDYNGAIADATQEQLLLNLVRLRYAETPLFLRVSSVISQYSRISSVDAAVGGGGASQGGRNVSGSVGGGVTWADRPTITYVPVSGREFSRNLLRPLPPAALFEMMMSGWPAELVLRVSVWSINGINNAVARPSYRRRADPKLAELFEVWRRLRHAGVLGMHRVAVDKDRDELAVFLLDRRASPELARYIAQFRELLRLDSSAREFRLTYGLLPDESNQIAVLTGSVFDIMLNLAYQFGVPDEHVSDGRTAETARLGAAGERPPIQIRFSRDEPENAFVAVKTQGYWFYIDQNDRTSKRAFSFLQLLLNLAETEVQDQGPLVTISN